MENNTTRFTDRFLRLPIFVVKGFEEEAMGHNAPKQKITARIDPLMISAYFPDFAEKGEPPRTAVLMKDGSSHCVLHNISDFEDILNSFMGKTTPDGK